ncbi:MAG: primosomal protein N', partial [Gloeomargarita sp. SKYG116]|nr:primosomal protein N' [Gloeomargarita sp. SKYG116]MDW8402270.1 primosomal protein N' [Gloeomargarita sp. SKYGB_i_bin116]
MSSPWVEVLVDVPGTAEVLTYAAADALPGDVVQVPVGARTVLGLVLGWLNELPPALPPAQVKPVTAVVHRQLFPPDYAPLLQKVADYYQVSLASVWRLALPPGVFRRSQTRIRLATTEIPAHLSKRAHQVWELLRQGSGDYSRRYIEQQAPGCQSALRELTKKGVITSYCTFPPSPQTQYRTCVTLIGESSTPLTPAQKRVVDWLRHQGGEAWLTDVQQQAKTSTTTLRKLAELGVIALDKRPWLRREMQVVAPDQPRHLTLAQRKAVDHILRAIDAGAYTEILLHGVTGSGKTEVYLQAITEVIRRGRQALVLLPEIGLTPQVTDRFRARLGAQVWVYHSGLSAGERYDTWRAIWQGEATVVIGTRSAVFAPLPQLGLVVLDEEHDASFKQSQMAPCYHAQTVARWRAQIAHCPIVLGSATPSAETWHRLGGSANYLVLPERIPPRPLPPIHLVDMRTELAQHNFSLFSRLVQQKLVERVSRGEQVMIFVPRRGHSTFVSCRACGYVLECPRCDVSMTYHQEHPEQIPLLYCHYCNWRQGLPQRCPACGSPYFKHFGCGTQRVVQELQRLWPRWRVLRYDRDSTSTKGAHRDILTQFQAGDADVLVGTQMLTKGLDLPQVTLVVVLAADGLLHLADFRAQERAAQTFLQVAGRAGRGDQPGEVIIQTYNPDHPVLQAVRAYDYAGLMRRELQQRQELGYPPWGRLVLLRFSGLDAHRVQHTAERLAVQLQAGP